MDRIMRHFFCFLEDDSIEVADLDDSTLFRFIQVAADTKQGTMYRVVRAMRLISDYIKRHHMAELKVDFSMLQVKSTPVRMIAPFSHDEINQMMSCINIKTPCGIRDQAILLLAFETGLRAIDIIRLRKSDIDWRNAEVHVIQSKTNEPLSLPLNGMVMNAVADYMLKARPESDAREIFLTSKAPYKPFSSSCSLDRIIEKYRASAGVEKKPYRSFHSLRRSFATELSVAGVPLPTISQMLGHKSIRADRPYLSYDSSLISFCALGFDGIQITGGIYASALAESPSPSLEGSDD
jgi:integrase